MTQPGLKFWQLTHSKLTPLALHLLLLCLIWNNSNIRWKQPVPYFNSRGLAWRDRTYFISEAIFFLWFPQLYFFVVDSYSVLPISRRVNVSPHSTGGLNREKTFRNDWIYLNFYKSGEFQKELPKNIHFCASRNKFCPSSFISVESQLILFIVKRSQI